MKHNKYMADIEHNIQVCQSYIEVIEFLKDVFVQIKEKIISNDDITIKIWKLFQDYYHAGKQNQDAGLFSEIIEMCNIEMKKFKGEVDLNTLYTKKIYETLSRTSDI